MDPDNGPLVTAVIPVYNHEKYVAESIQSIIRQTYRNVELIVINDGSKDRSHEVITSLAEECRQRFVRFEYLSHENAGLTASLNQALGMAKGKYVSAMASDDVALPEKIKLLVEALELKGDSYAAAFGNALFINDSGQPVFLDEDEQITEKETATTFSDYMDFRTNHSEVVNYRSEAFGTFPTLLQHNYLPAMSNVVRVQVIREAGALTRGNLSEDWEMWRKLAKKYKFTYVDRPVALYRWHESNAVKIMSGGLKYWSFILLEKERKYCEDHGLVELWKQAYFELMLPLWMDKGVPLARKLATLKPRNMFLLSPYIMRRAVAKAMRTIEKRKVM